VSADVVEQSGPERRQRIVIVRHGETEWSRIKRHTGRTDIPLTDEGRRQARELVDTLAGLTFEAVFVSPLRRARETCAIVGFGDLATVDPDLVEWDYGAYEGKMSAEVQQQRPGWNLFRDGVPEGETIDDVAARAARVIERVRAVSGDVLVFGHGHQLRVVTALWLEYPAAAAQHLLLETASPSTLGYERDWTALLSWNGLHTK
jgi:broad specificity phosphatase PhoE